MNYNNPRPEIIEAAPPPQTHLADGITGPVKIPFLQAVITGALAGIFFYVLASVARDWFWTNLNQWTVAVLVWTGVTFYAWLGYRGRWQYVLEQYLGIDLNRDGVIGQPYYEPPPPVRVELIRNNGNNVDYIDVPYYSEMKQLAPHLLKGVRTFSIDGVAPVLGRKEFKAVSGEFLTRGLARWKNPKSTNQGLEFTAAGRAILRRMAGEPGDEPALPPPPPTRFFVGPGEDPDTN